MGLSTMTPLQSGLKIVFIALLWFMEGEFGKKSLIIVTTT